MRTNQIQDPYSQTNYTYIREIIRTDYPPLHRGHNTYPPVDYIGDYIDSNGAVERQSYTPPLVQGRTLKDRTWIPSIAIAVLALAGNVVQYIISLKQGGGGC